MPRPRVFVSSTYLDLRDVRSSVEEFLRARGFEPTLFERGGVYYDPSLPLDKSCVEEVRASDLFILILGGRYGSPVSDEHKTNGLYNSVTRQEYQEATALGIPAYTFVRKEVDVEFRTYLNNKPRVRDNLEYAHVDDPQVFHLLEKIYQLKRGNPIFTFERPSDIEKVLQDQLAGMVGSALRQKRQAPSSAPNIPINGYKLFFWRTHRGFSFTTLQKEVGINRNRLRRLEKVHSPAAESLTTDLFQTCSVRELERIEHVLDCEGNLRAGKKDDFLSKYIHYYATYKGKSPQKVHASGYYDLDLFPARAVVFDFDGTLTKRSQDFTTWELIWVALGYDVSECAYYHRQFSEGRISHDEWCNLTRDRFRKRGLTQAQLAAISDKIELLDDASEVLTDLNSRGIRLYLLSGSIRQVIKRVLGNLCDLFEEIQANNMLFDKSGVITDIRGTRFDFAGKADFIRELIDRSDLSPLEVLFVGNSCNDVFASRSGARTLCINPYFTNPHVLDDWTYFLREVKSLKQVLPFIEPP